MPQNSAISSASMQIAAEEHAERRTTIDGADGDE